MSDCRVPMPYYENPERPTLKRLAQAHGEPPWSLEVPDFGLLPEEATFLIGELVWRGVRFRKVEDEP